MTSLVLTVIGEDRPGLVARLAAVVAENGGNWENSQLARLAGTFAGIVEIAVESSERERVVDALRQLDGLLAVNVRASDDDVTPSSETFSVEITGADHPGIVAQITAALQRGGASIDSLATSSVDAPMSGGRVFEARATVRMTSGADVDALERDLQAIAGDLMVDVTVVGA